MGQDHGDAQPRRPSRGVPSAHKRGQASGRQRRVDIAADDLHGRKKIPPEGFADDRVSAESPANERHRATEKAAASRIATDAKAAERRITAAADAEAIRAIEGQRVALEIERLAAYRDLPASVLMGLAAREFAGKIETIEHLNLTPDLLGSLLSDLARAGTRRLDAGTAES